MEVDAFPAMHGGAVTIVPHSILRNGVMRSDQSKRRSPPTTTFFEEVAVRHYYPRGAEWEGMDLTFKASVNFA